MEQLSNVEYRNKITYLSFAWAVLVIIRHAYNIQTYLPLVNTGSGIWLVTEVVENTIQSMSSMAVPGFFFMSGYLFYQNFQMDKLADKWKSRVKTYVVPYLIWTILPYLFYVGLTHSPLQDYLNRGVVQLSLDRLLDAVFISEFNVLWFLKYLIVYTAAAPVFYLLLKNRKIPIGMITIAVLLVLQYNGMLEEVRIFYVVGCYVGLNHREFMHIRERKLDWACAMGLFVSVIILAFANQTDFLSNLGIAVMLFLVWNAMNLLPLKSSLDWKMGISFFVYCTHCLILETIEKMLFVFGGGYDWMPLVDFVAAPVCTLGLIMLAAYVLRTYTRSLWRVITGDRG